MIHDFIITQQDEYIGFMCTNTKMSHFGMKNKSTIDECVNALKEDYGNIVAYTDVKEHGSSFKFRDKNLFDDIYLNKLKTMMSKAASFEKQQTNMRIIENAKKQTR